MIKTGIVLYQLLYFFMMIRRKQREQGLDVSSSSDDSWGDGKTAVKYGKGSRRGKKYKDDNRDIGYDDP